MRYRYWMFICGFWLLVGIFFSSQVYFYSASTARPVPLLKALLWQGSAAMLFALATPPVLWLARRFRIERRNLGRNLLIHIAAGIVIASLTGAGHVTLDLLFSKGFIDKDALFKLPRLIFFLADKELSIYWLIVLVSHAFDYYNRYQSGELRAAQLETQLAQAQLQSLKMQLHPHFLFNALNAISELIYKDPDTADAMLSQLGDMLRLSLDRVGVQEVPLQQELEFLKKYLEIERTRFQERIRVEMSIADGVLDARVPNMILQPIVENAVRYAVAPRSSGGRIEIRARRENNMLRLDVCDNGRGLPIDMGQLNKKNGVGLSNTQARLQHLYGSSHHFDLLNSPGGGLTVSMAFPFRESSTKDGT